MTILDSTLSPNHRATAAEYRRHGYFANGWDAMRRWNGRSATASLAGIQGPDASLGSWTPTPTGAPGETSIGLHVFRYRYMDSTTGYVSNPSEEIELEVASTDEELTFPIDTTGAANIIRSTDDKVDRIIMEMSVVGGSEFFKAAEALNSASTLVLDVNDAYLETQFLAWPDDGHDVPPIAKHVVSHRERLWLFGQVTHEVGTADFTNGSPTVAPGSTDPDWVDSALDFGGWFIQKNGDTVAYEIASLTGTDITLKANYAGTSGANQSYKIFSRAQAIWVSRPGYPEAFEPEKFLNVPNGEGSGDITAGLGYGSSMLFFSLQGMTKFAWDTDPLVDGIMIPLGSKNGALNQRVVIEVEGRVYAMDRRGINMWEGVNPRLVSRPIGPLFEDLDWTLSENFHCCFFPDIRAIRWFVVYNGDTYAHDYFQLDVDTGAWSTGEYYQGISESKLVPTATGPRVMLGDDQGHTWFADTGTADGVPGSLSHITAAVGSTTSVIATSTSLPVVGVGLAGCYIMKFQTGGVVEARLITSNLSDQISVNAPFGSVPTAGDVFWVGPIPTKLKTKAYTARMSSGKKKRSSYFWLMFVPTEDPRQLQIRVYEDLSDTPKTWALARTARPNGTTWPGANTDYASSDWLIDLSEETGNVGIPIGSEWRRSFEVEIEILEPDADFEIITMQHDGQAVEDND